jgi:hypothetical protein
MPRLNQFTIKITTGANGLTTPVRCNFNSHIFELENFSGGTGSGGACQGEFSPHSFVHGFSLVGPDEGSWDVMRVDMHYETPEQVWDLSFGPVTLDATNELNLWYLQPAEAWDV